MEARAGEGSSEFGNFRWLNRLAAQADVRVAFTAKGRERFLDYVDLLESIVHDSGRRLRGRQGSVLLPEGGA